MKLSIQFLTLTFAMAALTVSQAKMGGGLDSRRHLQSGQCEICSEENKNRPDYLTLEYVPEGVNSIFQDSSKATCVAASYPTQTTIMVTNKDGDKQVVDVQAGSVFKINGPFDAETDFYFDNNRDCFIHTSCSVPLVAGDQIGPFKVLAGTGCDNGGGPPQTENPPQTESGQCEICSKENKNRPDYLTIEYVPQGVNSIFQDSSKATCVAASYPTQTTITVTNKDGDKQVVDVQAGSVFKIDGPFDAETDFYFGNNRDCFIHTSCSVPLVAGDQIGPFKVLAGTGCDNGGVPPQTENPPSATPCEICSKANKNKPDKLTLMYKSDGKNSIYQDSSKATCREGMYQTSTTIVTTNKNDQMQTIPVTDGSVFEINGQFESKTVFMFGNGFSCYIHTSCSVPLVAGDQIGPFVVLEGNGCKYETPSPSAQPSPSPSAQPTGTPSAPPTAQPTDTPSAPPTAQPTDTPSTPPTPGPSPSPSAQPTGTPSAPPTAQPTATPSAPPTAQPTATPSAPPTLGPSPSPSAQPTATPSTPPTPGPSPSPSNSPSSTPSMTPTKAACVEVNENNYAEGEDIIVSYNVNFNEMNPLVDGLVCIYPCNVACPGVTLSCGKPAPDNCAKTDSTGEFVFKSDSTSQFPRPVTPFIQADGSLNRCFKAIIFRNEDATPVAQCCSEDFFVGVEQICEASGIH